MRILILLLISTFAFSTELTVKGRKANYKLFFNKNIVSLKGHLVDLSIMRKNCNEKIISSFENEINRILKKVVKHQTHSKDALMVISNEDQFYIQSQFKQAHALRDMRNIFLRKKLRSEKKCKK